MSWGAWLVTGVRKAKIVGVLLAAAGVVVIALAVVDVQRSEPSSAPPTASASEPAAAVQIDGNEAGSREFLPLGTVLGVNRPAPPPVSFALGRPPGGADALDLSTPAAAVYCVLSLIDEDKTDKLAACFVDGTYETSGNLYPDHLGHPVGLVDVVEDEEAAKVTWEATVHTAFTRNGKQWSPGETITLSTHLVQVDGLWKLTKLYDGEEDGAQQDDVPID
jgi:hypothetical protein